eukprot:TRINITY_DN400_c0_g1_i3.p1 TRINITY_DN400_c0_g1~~TRINITY_DN400_c0_g1_i3.p1  ORF type:complete len:147 (+),score=19.70 TRINITY_DN400_c0_g1_i3:54-443(+)
MEGVLIPLQSKGVLLEWAMVELQGSLDLRHTNQSDSLSCEQLEIGTLALKENGAPTMTIGSHLLEGAVVELKKPLLVIRNTTTTTTVGAKDNEGVAGDPDSPPKTYNVVGVVKRKFLFRSRPKPVASSK